MVSQFLSLEERVSQLSCVDLALTKVSLSLKETAKRLAPFSKENILQHLGEWEIRENEKLKGGVCCPDPKQQPSWDKTLETASKLDIPRLQLAASVITAWEKLGRIFLS